MKLFIMGGTNTSSIADVFEARSSKTIKIEQKISKFSTSMEMLQSSRVSVDRMVIYLESTMNPALELKALMRLLAVENTPNEYQKNVYFTVPEIYIFLKESEESDSIVKAYRNSLNKLNFVESKIVVKKQILFSDIFDVVMKTKTGNSNKNKYKAIYVQDKNNRARYSYDEELYSGVIEPFDLSSYSNYSNMKELVIRAETGAKRLDDETRNTGLGTGESVSLGKLKSNQLYSTRALFDIFTGSYKSGTSSLVTAVAKSYLNDNKKLIVLDYSRTQNTVRLFDKYEIEDTSVKICKPRDLFFGGLSILRDNDLIVFSIEDNIESSTIFVIENLVHLGLRNIIVDCDLDQLDSIIGSIERKINKIVVTASREEGDLEYIYKSISNQNSDLVYVLFSGENNESMFECNYLEAKTILKGYQVLSGYTFNLFEANDKIYNGLLDR